ncbi:hypothetical protein ABZ826_09435 [Streptomyces sp. NPDC047515]|uniref:hypothetical protein n=1 Tax=Streptomyces sp. NPDC047515 TaxID=3155380 RepID=UPI0033D3258C
MRAPEALLALTVAVRSGRGEARRRAGDVQGQQVGDRRFMSASDDGKAAVNVEGRPAPNPVNSRGPERGRTAYRFKKDVAQSMNSVRTGSRRRKCPVVAHGR